MKVIKIYIKYQITLSNLLVLSFLVLFLSISYFINSYDLNYSLSYDQMLDLYYENSLYYTKIIIVFLVCFLFMKLKNEKIEYLINIVITAGYNKKNNFFGMIASNVICILIVISILFLNFILIGHINMNFFVIELNYLFSYLNLIILSIYYGLLTYLIIQVSNNQMIFILVIIMFLLSDMIINMPNTIKYIYLCIFPNINNTNGVMFINIIYILFNILILIIINLILYLKKDLKG